MEKKAECLGMKGKGKYVGTSQKEIVAEREREKEKKKKCS